MGKSSKVNSSQNIITDNNIIRSYTSKLKLAVQTVFNFCCPIKAIDRFLTKATV
jgi:hypothetical protein